MKKCKTLKCSTLRIEPDWKSSIKFCNENSSSNSSFVVVALIFGSDWSVKRKIVALNSIKCSSLVSFWKRTATREKLTDRFHFWSTSINNWRWLDSFLLIDVFRSESATSQIVYSTHFLLVCFSMKTVERKLVRLFSQRRDVTKLI